MATRKTKLQQDSRNVEQVRSLFDA